MKTVKSLAILAIAAVGAVASAVEDRELHTVTAHRVLSNVPESEIDELVEAGYRMTDIEIASTSPRRYTASFVRNAGEYASNWSWTAFKTEAEFNAYIEDRQVRAIDIEVDIVNGQRRFAGVFVPNGRTSEKQWDWFRDQTWQGLQNLVSGTGSRLVDLDVRVVDGQRRFHGVILRNQGDDYRDFKYFSNITRQEVSSLLAQHRMRLVDLERISENRFAGVMQRDGRGGTPLWWWQTGRTFADLSHDLGQNNARVIDVERYMKGGKAYFNYVLINNANAIETRVGSWLRTNSDGARGFILKEVGGPVRAQMLPDYRFYPASTIKVLEHFYWTWRIDKFNLIPVTQVPRYSDHTSDTHPANGSTIVSTPPLVTVMSNSMVNSNNQDANALQDFAGSGNGVTGRAVINSFAKTILGLTDDVKLNHKFADQGANSNPANVATMRQLAKLYERSADGTVLSAGRTDMFRNLMLGDNVSGSFRNSLRQIVTDEGTSLGLTGAERTAFWNECRSNWKAGNWPAQSRYVSGAGWVRLPYREDGQIKYREFTLGAFVDDFKVMNLSITNQVMPELMREQVRAAMSTW